MGLLSAGIFQGLGAGVSAFGGQMMRGAEKEQDEALLQQRARVLAEIQRENAKLNRQDALDFETDPNNLGRRTAAARTTTLAAADTAREVETASLADPKLNEARRKKAADDAAAAKKIKDDQTIADAGNKPLLDAQAQIKLADPVIAAQIAASKAAAASSGAHAGLLAKQTEGAKLDIADKKRLGKLYDEASGYLTNPDMTDDERGKKIAGVMQQIGLIKSKNAAGGTRDPELDTQTVTEERQNEDGSTTKTTRKEVRRPGAAGGKPNMTEAQAHAEAAAAVAQGAPADAVNARLQGLGFNPLPGKKPAAAKTPEPAKPAPAVESRPAPDAMAQTVAAELAPVVEQYKAAQAQLAAASKSGDATSLARYAQAVQALRTNIERQANDRLGNGAQRYLSSLGL